MLPKINRLKSDRDFRNVFKNGGTLENQLFRVKYLKNQKNASRFGFIISAKISKKATIRNFLKRRLRAVSRYLIKDLKPGFDIVVWPKKISITADYDNLAHRLQDLINKL